MSQSTTLLQAKALARLGVVASKLTSTDAHQAVEARDDFGAQPHSSCDSSVVAALRIPAATSSAGRIDNLSSL